MRNRYSGFTLMELMIAIMIFALLASATHRLVMMASRTQSASESALRQLNDWYRLRLLLENDFSQLVQRPIRNEQGEREAALLSSASETYFVTLTRTGWQNPFAVNKSHLQRIAYRLNDQQLIRLSWSQPDRAPGSQPAEQVIMTGLKNLQVRFLDRQQQWHRNWPPAEISSLWITAAAVEFRFVLADLGTRTLLMPLPGQYQEEYL